MNDKVMIGVVGYRDPKTGAFLNSEPIYAERTQEITRERESTFKFAAQLFAEIIAAHG